MKIVFFLENPKHIAGGDYFILRLANELAKRDHDIIVFTKNQYDVVKLVDTDIYTRGALKRYFKGIGFINRIYDKFYTKICIETFLKKNHDVNYLIGYLRDSAVKCVNLGEKFDIKTVNFVFENPAWMKRDLSFRFEAEYKGRFKKSWRKTREAYLKTDILLGISKTSKTECEKWLKKDLNGYVYPGIDLKEFISKNYKKNNQVVYLGRLNPYKNIDLIFNAISKIKNPPKLILIGEGEDKKPLVKLSEKLSVEADFKGNLDDKTKISVIKKSLFMVFPSSHEGFGMPPMEALACEIPCICSDKLIFKEVYEDKVEYFKENDVEDLKEKIGFLLKNTDYCKKRGKQGRKYIEKKFSWKKSVDKFERILKNGK
ncbi:glycosyltransferase [Candidatus Woesearchaeota archaeon]|nr:glycosyltransferase [Candidatus Woesearchaeota archaeon]